ncbi:MAG: hypothetical protein MI723_09355, partial [Caulobacterales bacterium]|nr:hypothetical protein [Caulobacterales bacterium]
GDMDAALCLVKFWRGLVDDLSLRGTVSQELGWLDLYRASYYAALIGTDIDPEELAAIAQTIEPDLSAAWRDSARGHVRGLEAVDEYERRWGALPLDPERRE